MVDVLLTGGTGFLGARVARRLLREGFSVALLARAESSLVRLGDAAGALRVLRPAATAPTLLAGVADVLPRAVVHIAAVSRAGEAPDDVARMVAANVTLPALLLAAMREVGVPVFLNTGTSWQSCGPNGTQPFNVYSATKTACETMIDAFCLGGLRAITLRLFDTYGPDDGRGKVVDIIADAALTGRPLAMSPGGQVIDLVHVDDAADAYVAALGRLLVEDVAGHTVHGVSGERLTLRALAARIGGVAAREPPIEWGGRPYRPREVMRPWDGYAPVPGWAPRIGLEDGLRQVLASRAMAVSP